MIAAIWQVTWMLWMMGPGIPGGIAGPLHELPTYEECLEQAVHVRVEMRKQHPNDLTTQYFCTPSFKEIKPA